ncbi:MAG: ABC-2 family transporter protein [Verrucomicrobia bacterium]|nr:ABC-2 family transporter protein [Verrucomicrobiota bacterium]
MPRATPAKTSAPSDRWVRLTQGFALFSGRQMKKYWQVINIGIQNTLVYRVNFLFRVLFGFIPLVALLSMWRVIYQGRETSVAGYTLAQMVSYYLIMTVVDALTAVNEDDWQIAADIKDGQISQFLLKPIDYLAYRFCLFTAGRLIYAAVATLPVAGLILYYREAFVLPPDLATFGWFALSVVMTALLQFFISYTMALLAFWVLEVSTFIFIVFAFEYIAGGHLFPVDILPPAVLDVLYLTPFPYQLFFPVQIYLGRATGAELYQGMAVQAAWVIVAFLLARFVWSRGIRRYSAVGG